MSSGHYVIVARNTVTGELRLPLGDMTLYGEGKDPETGEHAEESLVRTCAMDFDEDWTLTLYGMVSASYGGSKKKD